MSILPPVSATGAGASAQKAIGITTFAGMILATFVGIIFTPSLYALTQRLREWLKSSATAIFGAAANPVEHKTSHFRLF